MYVHTTDNTTYDEQVGALPSQAPRLDDPTKIVLGLPYADVATQEACGWYAVTDTPQPTPAAGDTVDRSIQNVNSTWTVVWTERPMTTQEQADATASTNRATLLTQAANALTANATFLGLPDPTANNNTYLALSSPTNAQVVAQVKALTQQSNAYVAQLKALTQQVDKLIRLATNVLDATS